MSCRCWRVMHVLLSLATVACCAWLVWKEKKSWYPEDRELASTAQPTALDHDDALRRFFNLGSVGGLYRLPEGENYGVIAILWFENGKFLGRKDGQQFTGSPEGTRVFSYSVVWGQGAEGKPRLVLYTRTPNASSAGLAKDEVATLFSKLDGEQSTSVSWPTDQVRGYRILAYMTSRKIRPGGKSGTWGDFAYALKTRESVAVIGVKTFPSPEQMEEWFDQREPVDP